MKPNRLDDQLNSILVAAFIGIAAFTAADVLDGASFGRQLNNLPQTTAQAHAPSKAIAHTGRGVTVVAAR